MIPVLAAAADQRRGHQGLAAGDQRAGALRSAQLVGGEDQEVGTDFLQIERNAPGRLYRVDQQQATMPVYDGRRLADRLDDAGFVVDRHHRHQRQTRDGLLGGKQAFDRLEIRQPLGGHRNFADLIGRESAALAHCRMLDRRDVEVTDRQSRLAHTVGGRQHQVGGFGRAAREDDIGRCCADERRHLAAGRLDDRPGCAPLGMHGTGIARKGKRLGHGNMRRRHQGGGCIPVEIDALLGHTASVPRPLAISKRIFLEISVGLVL